MRRTMIATACILVAAPAFAQSVGEKTGVNSMLGVSPSTADFVKEVALSDMFEIEASKLAQQKGNAAEKTFASQMVTDHTRTSTELKGLVSSGKLKAELPTALDGSYQSKLDKLKGAGGNDFSSEFNSMQVRAHKDAVDLFEDVLEFVRQQLLVVLGEAQDDFGADRARFVPADRRLRPRPHFDRPTHVQRHSEHLGRRDAPALLPEGRGPL